MLFFVVYLLVLLASPLFLFGLVSFFTSGETMATRETKAARPRKRPDHDLDAEMAVLEAQFIVAPRMAFDEARELLAKTTDDANIELTTLINRRSFEHMLRELAISRARSAPHR